MLSSKHLITTPHVKAAFHMNLKSKLGTDEMNITAPTWTQNSFILFHFGIVHHKMKKKNNPSRKSHI